MSERRVRVRLGERSYTVTIGAGILGDVGERVARAVGRRPRTALIVSNSTVYGLYGDQVRRRLESAGYTVAVSLIGDGERFKRLGELERVIGTAAAAELERTDPVIALGGGVVGDLAGLAAALYMRGTPFVQVPTTLLSQIDSSVGGKVAVNHTSGKNLIGAFHQPAAVLADTRTLSTLPGREFDAGLFEAIKYGLLGDASLFSWMERRMDALREGSVDDLAHLIAVCCRIKARVVETDETETGLRRVLNLGHTAGHALESVTRYRRFLHGEAVGYGLEVAAAIGVALGTMTPAQAGRVRRLVSRAGTRPRMDDLDRGALIAAMRHDKKRSGGRVAFVVPIGIGKVAVRSDVDENAIRLAIESMCGGSRLPSPEER